MKINNKILYILALTSFIFFVLSCYFTHIVFYQPNAFFLFESLNFFYWIGIIAFIMLIILRIIHPIKSIIFDLSIIFIAIFYTGIVSFIYEVPRNVDTYRLYWELFEPAIKLGTFNTNLINFSNQYHYSYITSSVFLTYVVQLHSDPYLILRLYTIYYYFFGSIIIYVIGRFISEKYAVMGSLAFILFYWLPAQFSPQTFTFLIIFSLFLALFKFLQTDERKYAIIASFYVVVIALSHMLSNIIIIFILSLIYFCMVLFYVLNKYGWMPGETNFFQFNNQKQSILQILIISVLAYLSYASYAANTLFSITVNFIDNRIDDLVDYDGISLTHRSISDLFPPSASYLMAYNIRMLTLIIYIIIGIVCTLFIIYSFRFKEKFDVLHKKILLIFTLIFLFAVSFSAILLLSGDNTYGYDRPFPISLVMFSLLIVFFISFEEYKLNSGARKTLIILLFIGLLITTPISRYASDPYHFFSESEDQANLFGRSYFNDFQIGALGVKNSYSSIAFNSKELKYQRGSEYAKQYNFITLSKIYDVGNSASHYF